MITTFTLLLVAVLMARRSHPIPSVALILWVLLSHVCSGVCVELGATVGESVTFVCTVNVSAGGSVSWQWSKDGVVLTQSNSRVVGVGTANLTILPVEESDFGNYSCSPNPADNLRRDFILSGNYVYPVALATSITKHNKNI